MAHARKGHVALGGVTDEILLTTDGLDEMGAVGRFPDEEMQDGRAWGRHAVAVPAPQHPSCNTLTHTGCLDRSFSELGEKREADEPAEMMMWLETGVLGSHPPNTFFSMRSLASSYMDDGRYAEATGLQVMVLLYVWIVFGHRHRHTLIGSCRLASTYSDLCRYVEAAILCKAHCCSRPKCSGLIIPTPSPP